MNSQSRFLASSALTASILIFGASKGVSLDERPSDDNQPKYVALVDPESGKKRTSDEVSYSTIDKGAVSGVQTQENLTVRDECHWIHLWSRHARSRTSPKVVPSVDFEKNMVIAVFQGDKSNSKDMIRIEKIRLFKDRMVVLLGHQSMGAGSSKTTLRSYHIVSLPRTDLPVYFH